MHDTSPQQLNPWFSVWMQPRDTIQQIVAEDPKRMVLFLTVLPSLIQGLGSLGTSILHGLPVSMMSFFLIILGESITSIIILYLNAALTCRIGRWFDGDASSENIRAVMAWSMIPALCGLSLMLLGITLSGMITFLVNKTSVSLNNFIHFVQIGLVALQVAAAIWSFVIYLKMLSQVQDFSIWKALGNTLVSGLIIAVLGAAVFIALVIIIGLSLC